MTAPQLGPVGVWLGALLGQSSAASSRATAEEIERLGYGSLWVGETPMGREPFVNAAVLLSATKHLVVGTGIANVWGREATTMRAACLTLAEAFPDRFILGLGVSHKPMVELSGVEYSKPLTKMRTYLEELESVTYAGLRPEPEPAIVLAALRPKMLELARDASAGAHPYFVPPEHTAQARGVLGDGPLLVPEQAVVLETDPTRAREIAREHTGRYLQLPNYVNNLRALGYTDDDVAGGGSDRLVDAIVAWGDEDAITARVNQHRDAGADHVLIQPLGEAERALEQLRALSPALTVLA